MGIVLIQKFNNEPEAQMVKSFLESQGVPCSLSNSHSSSVYPVLNFTIGGIELWVKVEDFEKAERLIKKFEGEE